RPTYQAQASIVEPEGTMDVPVFGHPEASVVGDVGSVSRPTGTNKDGFSRDGKMPPPKEGVRDTAVRPTTGTGPSGYYSRGGRGGVGLLALGFVSAINLANVESKMLLVQLPSGFRCIWYNLPHLVQFVVLFMMVVLLYGVNRAFDKADEAMSTRLSCATTAFLDERRHYHYAAPRRVF
ncbi:unnamed protein product, partial [Ectocarpus fasciculatus]